MTKIIGVAVFAVIYIVIIAGCLIAWRWGRQLDKEDREARQRQRIDRDD